MAELLLHYCNASETFHEHFSFRAQRQLQDHWDIIRDRMQTHDNTNRWKDDSLIPQDKHLNERLMPWDSMAMVGLLGNTWERPYLGCGYAHLGCLKFCFELLAVWVSSYCIIYYNGPWVIRPLVVRPTCHMWLFTFNIKWYFSWKCTQYEIAPTHKTILWLQLGWSNSTGSYVTAFFSVEWNFT